MNRLIVSGPEPVLSLRTPEGWLPNIKEVAVAIEGVSLVVVQVWAVSVVTP
jgi:hypothetical protein